MAIMSIMPPKSSELPHKVRHPGVIQHLAMWGRRVTDWHEEFDHKLVYVIGATVSLRFIGKLSVRTSQWTEWLEFPLELIHAVTVIILLCGAVNVLCRFIQNRFYPDE